MCFSIALKICAAVILITFLRCLGSYHPIKRALLCGCFVALIMLSCLVRENAESMDAFRVSIIGAGNNLLAALYAMAKVGLLAAWLALCFITLYFALRNDPESRRKVWKR